MIDENILRMKFYMAPKMTTYEELVAMNEKFTNYPGLTSEQATNSLINIQNQYKDVIEKAKMQCAGTWNGVRLV